MKVINCSRIDLTPAQIALLKRGLKFCPTPQAGNNTELSADIRSLSRRMRLNEFFHGKDFSPESLLKKPSNFNPPLERDEHLDRYCDFLYSLASNLDHLPVGQRKDNLTRFERAALRDLIELRNSNKIVVMPADKGGAVVVLEADHYKRMVEDVFDDPEYFEDCDGNQMKSTIGKIKALCDSFKSCLTKDEITCLTNFEYKEANFYGLPKIHKSILIKEAVKQQKSEVVKILSPSDLKIRPIIGGPASPTSNLSKLVDRLLKPFMTVLPSYVRDSLDLLRQAEDWEATEGEEYTLLTMDISNMYMNISEDLGIKAIKFFTQKFPHPRFTTEFVVDAVLLVLRNNVSFFDGRYKRQNHGCAMGSHKSPPYASLAVGFIENEAYEFFRGTKGLQYASYVRAMLRRFLDDIFIKWRMSLGDPQELFDVLNSIEQKIKFTMETSKKIPFLNVQFEVESEGKMKTDIYYKETDTHNYVPFCSFHPKQTLTNIPYSLARRICIIVSDTQVRETRFQELKRFLVRKKYPSDVIECGINRARHLDRSSILRGTTQEEVEDASNIPFVYTNNCANPNVLGMVREGLSILAPSQRMKTVMGSKKVIAARRQPRNLKSLLFRPRFDTSLQTSKGSVRPCKEDMNRGKLRGRPCKCCDSLSKCTHLTFKGSDTPFELRFHFTCDTRNVLYALTCQGCGDNYIGKTEREVRERCGEYRNAIENKRFSQGVHEHLATCGKGVFVMTPFFKIHDGNRDSQTILSYETLFIQRYRPRLNVLKL